MFLTIGVLSAIVILPKLVTRQPIKKISHQHSSYQHHQISSDCFGIHVMFSLSAPTKRSQGQLQYHIREIKN